MKLSDLTGILHKSALTFVKAENPFGDYWRITLRPPENTTWTAGEHGIFTLPDREFKGRSWRVFSVASSPSEKVIIIGTRTGREVSGFKKELTAMKEGGRVNVRGPFGWFKVKDQTSPMVFAVGGVGITPVRAILKELEHNTARPLHLIYESKDFYLFGDELLAIAAANPALHISLMKTKEETKTALSALVREHGNKALYYVSGHPTYIKKTKQFIKQAGIKGGRIISDPFFGY